MTLFAKRSSDNDIKLSLNQYRAKFEARKMELNHAQASSDDDKEILVAEKNAVDAVLRNLSISYQQHTNAIKNRANYLTSLKHQYSEYNLDPLIAAISKGEDRRSENLIANIFARNNVSPSYLAELSLQRGLIAKDNINYKLALDSFIRAADLNKDNSQYLWHIADLYLKIGMSEKASDYAHKAWVMEKNAVRGEQTYLSGEISSKEIKLSLSIHSIDRGKTYLQQNKPEKALSALKLAKQFDPSSNDKIAKVLTNVLPLFPWPPPKPSTFVNIPEKYLEHLRKNNKITLAEVAKYLANTLDSADFSDSTYYAIPDHSDSFALVARMEQIEKDGTPKKGLERWSLEVDPFSHLSFYEYIKALFTANPGYFRLIVFVVSPRPIVPGKNQISRTGAIDLITNGATTLSDRIANEYFSSRHTCTALVYEFEKEKGVNEVKTIIPSRIPGKEHLAKAGIWSHLEK